MGIPDQGAKFVYGNEFLRGRDLALDNISFKTNCNLIVFIFSGPRLEALEMCAGVLVVTVSGGYWGTQALPRQGQSPTKCQKHPC